MRYIGAPHLHAYRTLFHNSREPIAVSILRQTDTQYIVRHNGEDRYISKQLVEIGRFEPDDLGDTIP